MNLFKSLVGKVTRHDSKDYDGKLMKEDFRVTGVIYCLDNIQKLACCNPDWKRTAAQIRAKEKTGEKIYRYNYVYKPVKLEPEPNNPHDKNAISVIIAGEHVGYIRKDDNIHVKKILKGRDIKYISAFVGGGQYKIISEDGEILRFDDDISIKVRIAYS